MPYSLPKAQATLVRRSVGLPGIDYLVLSRILGDGGGVPEEHPERPGWYASRVDIVPQSNGATTTYDMTVTYKKPQWSCAPLPTGQYMVVRSANGASADRLDALLKDIEAGRATTDEVCCILRRVVGILRESAEERGQCPVCGEMPLSPAAGSPGLMACPRCGTKIGVEPA